MSHQTHLFLEGENAPAEDVASIIDRVYKEIQATMLVASRSNKVRCDLRRAVLVLASVVWNPSRPHFVNVDYVSKQPIPMSPFKRVAKKTSMLHL